MKVSVTNKSFYFTHMAVSFVPASNVYHKGHYVA